MGINILIGKSLKENFPDNDIVMTQELHEYLYLRRENIGESDLLTFVDPYGDRIFEKNDIIKLVAKRRVYI